MSQPDPIDALAEQGIRLNEALQTGKADAIEAATEGFRAAVETVQNCNWTADPALKQRLLDMQPQLEEARRLACLLADMTGQMHDQVAAQAPDSSQPLYKRSGAQSR